MASRPKAPILVCIDTPVTWRPSARASTMTSFHVYSWPMISWSAQNIHRLRLVHFESCLDETTSPGPLVSGPCGRTVWGGLTPDGMAGIAWRWAQIQPGVLALQDPLDVRSNLAFTGSDGSILSPMAVAMILNRIVSSLPWQLAVQRELGSSSPRRVVALPQTAPVSRAC